MGKKCPRHCLHHYTNDIMNIIYISMQSTATIRVIILTSTKHPPSTSPIAETICQKTKDPFESNESCFLSPSIASQLLSSTSLFEALTKRLVPSLTSQADRKSSCRILVSTNLFPWNRNYTSVAQRDHAIPNGRVVCDPNSFSRVLSSFFQSLLLCTDL